MQESIKKHLHERFLSEEKVPGISVTKKVQDETGETNKEAQSEIKKKLNDYNKGVGEDKDTDIKKRELSDEEEAIRQNIEKKGGMQDLKFDSEVPDSYAERQRKINKT